MHFKHTLSIFSTNLSLSYKVLILIFIVAIIALAILVSIFNPLWQGINEALELEGLTFSLREIIEDPVNKLGGIWETATDFISANTGMLVSRFLFLSLLLVTVRFFISIALVPISRVIFSKMTSGYSSGLFNNLVAYLLPSLGYAFFSAIIFAILDLAIFTFSIYILYWLYKLINIGALFFVFILFMLLYSLRITLFSQWLSVICDGQKNIFKALVKGVKLSMACWKTYFPIMLTLLLLFATVVTTTLFTTLGILPMVAFTMFMVLFCITNLICYFNLQKNKYYIDEGVTAYDPSKHANNKEN